MNSVIKAAISLIIPILIAGCSPFDSGGPSTGSRTGGGETQPSESGGDDGSSDGGEGTEAEGQEEEGTMRAGGSTYAGNPLTINLKGAVALALTAEQATEKKSNLKKIVGSDVKEVLSYVGGKRSPASGSSGASAFKMQSSEEGGEEGEEAVLPTVSQMFLGPQGAVALLFSSSIQIEGNECSFVRLEGNDSTPECIDPEVGSINTLSVSQRRLGIPGGREGVQFDAQGNIYYLSGQSLRRWNVSDGMVQDLVDENIRVENYLVASGGSLFMQGNSAIGNIGFFRRLRPNGSLEDIVSVSAGYLEMIEEGKLLISGGQGAPSYTSGVYLLNFDDSLIGELETIFLNDGTLKDSGGQSVNVSFDDLQRSGDGDYYALTSRRVAQVYPEPPFILSHSMGQVIYFRLVDEDIFLVGQASSGQFLFHKMHLGDNSTEEDLLAGLNIQVYHFVVVNNVIYFDGLRFSDNKVIIGQIDQNDGNRLTELSPLQARLIGLEFIR